MKRSVIVFQYDTSLINPQRNMRGQAFYLGLSNGQMVVEWPDGTVEAVDLSMVQFLMEGKDLVTEPA